MLHRVQALPVLMFCLIAMSPAFAQTRPATMPVGISKALSHDEKLSITEHQIQVDGQILRYKATAGYLPAKEESGKEKANFFFVAYEKQGDLPQKRPITFVFNGGPGAAAVWLHLGTAGPMRVRMGNDLGEPPAPPYQLVENAYTWLDVTDLVFIDPIGTGYSRPAPGEKGEQFYGVKEDVASVGEFIRLYTTQYERWLSPKFLAGESYGTTRAAALSQFLADRYGIALNGIMLISVVLDFQTIQAGGLNDLPYVLYLPSYTAVAWYHKRLPAALQQDLARTLNEVRQFTIEQYMPALAKGNSLPQEDRQKLVEKLARYTGLPASFIDKANLRVEPGQFRKQLLESQGRLVGRFDARITGYDLKPADDTAEYDPSLPGYLSAYTATINDYLRRELNYRSDLPYEVLTDRVQPWNFGRGGMGYLDVARDLRSAMVQNPHLKVLFAGGYFDLATPFFASDYTVNHLNVGPALRGNITQAYYTAGHMVYHELASLQKLKADVKAFINQALVAKPR
ncbi:MAG: S10 family peptidase [Bacillota bacterium]